MPKKNTKNVTKPLIVPIIAHRPNTRSQPTTSTNTIATATTTTRSKATKPADNAAKKPRAKSNSPTPPPPVLQRGPRQILSSESNEEGDFENNAGPSKPPVLVRSARLALKRGHNEDNDNEVLDEENIASPISTERPESVSVADTENIHISTDEELEEGDVLAGTSEDEDKQVKVGKGQKNGREEGGKENVPNLSGSSSNGNSNVEVIVITPTRNVKTLNLSMGVNGILKDVSVALVRLSVDEAIEVIGDNGEGDSIGSEPGEAEVVPIKQLNLLPFSFPNLTEAGDREMNVLMVGANVVEISKGIRLNAANDKSCRGVFKIYQAPSLAESNMFTDQKNIHFVLMILCSNDPQGINTALEELRHLDPLFVGKKRVDFIMAAKNTSFSDRTSTHSTDVSQISIEQLKAFYETVGIAIRNIYQDEPDSVEFGTRHAYNKIKRLLTHPATT